MDLPTPPQAVAALATLVRDRLVEVSATLAPLWNRRDATQGRAALGEEHIDRSVVATARQLATVIVGAAAPFALTSYSRARLIRQMHASGLLSDELAEHTRRVLELEFDQHGNGHGAPR